MRPSTAAILKALARSKQAFATEAIMALREDLAAMTPEEAAAAFEAARRQRGEAAGGVEAQAAAALQKARRKLLISTERLIDLIIARLAEEDGLSVPALPKRARSSAPAFLRAVEGTVPPERVAAAAEAIARERSLAYDMA